MGGNFKIFNFIFIYNKKGIQWTDGWNCIRSCRLLGFATYENYYYVYTYAVELGVSSEAVAYIRAFSAVPMHGLNGCIMGFYFGQFVFTVKKIEFFTIDAFIFHGAYNFFIDVP